MPFIGITGKIEVYKKHFEDAFNKVKPSVSRKVCLLSFIASKCIYEGTKGEETGLMNIKEKIAVPIQLKTKWNGPGHVTYIYWRVKVHGVIKKNHKRLAQQGLETKAVL